MCKIWMASGQLLDNEEEMTSLLFNGLVAAVVDLLFLCTASIVTAVVAAHDAGTTGFLFCL